MTIPTSDAHEWEVYAEALEQRIDAGLRILEEIVRRRLWRERDIKPYSDQEEARALLCLSQALRGEG